MRDKNRIIPFLKVVDLDKLSKELDLHLSEKLKIFIKSEKFKEYWLNYPDLRFMQLLINLGVIKDIPSLYYTEDDEILEISES